jgi:ABC-type nitrate/sulfonate/bicarbonate transport system substrate-binding protein
MKRFAIVCLRILILAALFFLPAPVHSADKIKFPYSPVGWESLAWFVGKEGGYYEKYGLDVELFFQGASSEIIQAMLSGDANFAGIAGPAIISNIIGGGDVIRPRHW